MTIRLETCFVCGAGTGDWLVRHWRERKFVTHFGTCRTMLDRAIEKLDEDPERRREITRIANRIKAELAPPLPEKATSEPTEDGYYETDCRGGSGLVWVPTEKE